MATPPAQRILRGALLGFLCLLGCENVNVVAVDVATVEVTPDSLFMIPGRSDQLTARVLDENGDPLTGRTVAWSSVDGEVATVSNDGRVTAMGTGTTTVQATSGGVTGEATVSVDLTGSIQLSASQITFQAQQGGEVSPQNVQVTSGGSGNLSNLDFTVEYDGDHTGWLAPSLNHATTPATLTVGTNAGVVEDLDAGIYAGRVIVTAANATNSPLPLPVQLTISSPSPAIGLNPPSHVFAIREGSSSASPATVAVTNVGGGGSGAVTGLSVGAIGYGSGGNNWLKADLNRTSTQATLTLSLTSGASSLAKRSAPYTATVPVSSPVASNSPRNVTVNLTVGGAPQILLGGTPVTAETVAGTAPDFEPVTVTNGGEGTLGGLTVNILSGDDWLDAALGDDTAPTEVNLSAGAGLALKDDGTAKVYNATVRVSGSALNSPQEFSVALTVLPPASIVVAPNTLTFAAQEGSSVPAPDSVSIANGGSGSVATLGASVGPYSGPGTDWLEATVVGGPDAPAFLRLTPTAVPPEGTSTVTVTVTSTAPGVDPATMTVTFEVAAAPPPVLAIVPNTFTFEGQVGDPASLPDSVEITKTGVGSVATLGASVGSYSGPGSGWLQATVAGGPDAPAFLRLTPTAVPPEGTSTVTVTVTSTAVGVEPASMTVTFDVAPAPPPVLAITPNTFTFDGQVGGSVPLKDSVGITKTGVGSVATLGASVGSYSGPGSGWLQATVAGGPDAPAFLRLTPTAVPPEGTSTVTVTVTSTAVGVEPASMTVTFDVAPAPPPVLAITPNTFTFDGQVGGSVPLKDSVGITKTGVGSVATLGASVGSYSGPGSGWLQATVAGGPDAPAFLRLTPTAVPPEGTSTVTVTVTSTAVGVEPASMTVTFDVAPAPPPVLAITPNTFTFDGQVGGSVPLKDSVGITKTGVGSVATLGASVGSYSGPGSGWLQATVAGGPDAPAFLRLTPTAVPPEGTSTVTVTVTSTAVGVEPASMTVTFDVAPAALGAAMQDMEVDTEALSGAQATTGDLPAESRRLNVSVRADRTETNEVDNEASASVVVS